MDQQHIVPVLYCPFPSAVNRHRDAVQKHVVDWVRRFRLVQHEAALKRFRAAKFGWLASRAYPLAESDELMLAADWNVWLFMLDDQCDESGLGKDQVRLRQVFDELVRTISDATASAPQSPLAWSLTDLWQRMCERATSTWQARFLTNLQNYFDACVWEASNRASGVVPSIQEYIVMRPLTGGLITDIDLIDLTEHIDLPLAVREHPTVAGMTAMANNVVCWSNDIFSLAKEQQRGDFHNLVLLSQHDDECLLQQAVNKVAVLHDREVGAFLQLEETVPDWGDAVNADVRKYVGVLRSWMRGNMDWASETGRYSQPMNGVMNQPASYLEPIIEIPASSE